ncbi:MAG: exodeoxyribonuclease VII large subunit [Rhizobiales bacterium]|nr:exodeoxyribonuclease VII large subunit [Hyphomicrobiales bacterium]
MTMFDESPSNAAEFTVSELSGAVRRTVEDAFGHVRVRGEVGRLSRPGSGHLYFDLKDDKAVLSAVAWKGVVSGWQFFPEQGLEVIATGKLTTFPGQSRYQIIVEKIEPAGAGALMALLEARRKQLAGEGLFDEARKQLLPYMPRVIGVVTSPTGAVIRDILHRISDRFPLHVVVWPVRVQGESCGMEVANAINGFNSLLKGGAIARPDLIIVARGGGSLEDLWGFNDEAVVRAAAASDIPLISAVGHETDWTLIDHAADRRAPTPTGAAEMAVPVKAELEAMLANLSARLKGAQSRVLSRKSDGLRALTRALPTLDSLLALPRQRLDRSGDLLGKALAHNTANCRRRYERQASRISPLTLIAAIREKRLGLNDRIGRCRNAADRAQERRRSRLDRPSALLAALPRRLETGMERETRRLADQGRRADAAVDRILADRRRAVAQHTRMLASLSHRNVLARGFALVRDDAGELVASATSLGTGQAVNIEFADGNVSAVTAGTASTGRAQAKKPAREKPASDEVPAKPAPQGSLFD